MQQVSLPATEMEISLPVAEMEMETIIVNLMARQIARHHQLQDFVLWVEKDCPAFHLYQDLWAIRDQTGWEMVRLMEHPTEQSMEQLEEMAIETAAFVFPIRAISDDFEVWEVEAGFGVRETR